MTNPQIGQHEVNRITKKTHDAITWIIIISVILLIILFVGVWVYWRVNIEQHMVFLENCVEDCIELQLTVPPENRLLNPQSCRNLCREELIRR